MIEPWQAQLAATNSTVSSKLQASLDLASDTLEPLVSKSGDGSFDYEPYSAVSMKTRQAIQAAFYDVAQSLEEVSTGQWQAGAVCLAVERCHGRTLSRVTIPWHLPPTHRLHWCWESLKARLSRVTRTFALLR
jgi:hypothetical protein